MCTVEFLESRNWYSRNSDIPAVVENIPKSRSFHKNVPTSTVVLFPDPLFPTVYTSSIKETSNSQSSGPWASLVQTEETPENTEGDHDATEQAVEGNIVTEYSSD